MAIKKRNKKRRTFLRGVDSSSKFNKKQLAEDGTRVLCIVGGLVIGNIAHNTIDNVITKNGLEATDGIKKYIAPLATVALGIVVPQFIKNDMVKYVGYGVSAAGGIKTVKKAFDKDLLSGFDSIQGLMGEDVMLPGIGEMSAIAASQIDQYEQIKGKDDQMSGDDDQISGNEDIVNGIEEEIAGFAGDDDTTIV